MDRKPVFTDYLTVLLKWKLFLIINLILCLITGIAVAFLIPQQYKSTATIMIPPEDQLGLGGLTSLLGGKSSIASMGSRLFGVTNTSEDVLLGIVNSRRSLTEVINVYNLMNYYEIDDHNMDKALKAFRSDISGDPNEFGMIEFSVINKDPKVSADIANYLVTLVDSLNIEFNIQRARNNRIFIEKRYQQNVLELKGAEDSLYKFQKKYGIVAVPEQLEVTVKAAAEIEAQLIKKEMESYFMIQQYGESSPQYQGILAEITLLRKKVQELKSSTDLASTSNILFSFKQMPDISIKYLRLFREVEIQQAILEIVMPMYEQAKVEEQKSIPTVLVIDKAVPPQLKYTPKRLFIISIFFFIGLFILLPFIFWGEKLASQTNFLNPLQQKLSASIIKIKNFYRIKA